MPRVECLLVGEDDPEGPFGAKEAGEGPLVATLPAVANALYDAIGVRFNESRSPPTASSAGSNSVARRGDPGRAPGSAMHLDPFELHRPSTVDEVVRLTRDLGPNYDLLAGGTDLLPNYKMHLNLKPNLISLDGVQGLHGHTPGRIGAMARLGDLERDAELASGYPGLVEAIRMVATPLVRERATLGGNLLVETRCSSSTRAFRGVRASGSA